MADVSQMGNAETAHLENKNRVGKFPVPYSALALQVDNDDILYLGPYGIPDLLQCNSPENERIPAHRSHVVVGVVVIAHAHRIGLNAWGLIEVRVRHIPGPGPGAPGPIGELDRDYKLPRLRASMTAIQIHLEGQ